MKVRAAFLAGFLVMGVVAAGVGSAGAVGAAERDGYSLQFRGRAAGAFITNCSPVAQTPCDAWDVFAGDSSLRVNGRSDAEDAMFVAQLAVTWVDGMPNATYVAEGHTHEANVDIARNAGSGTASGTVEFETCSPPPGGDPEVDPWICEPTGESATITLSLVATGKADRFNSGGRESIEGSLFRWNVRHTERVASGEATLDGAPITLVMPPYGPPPLLMTDAAVEVCRSCGWEPPL
jgi:hypothetical protein